MNTWKHIHCFLNKVYRERSKQVEAFMKIGIDAKYYFSGTPSLISVVGNLSDKMIEHSGDTKIVFFLSKRDRHRLPEFEKKIGQHNNISYQFIPGKFNFIVNLLFYPFFFSNKEFDVILFQNYVPIWKGSKTLYVNYIHDFLFLDWPQFFSKLQRFVFRFMLYSVRRADHTVTISSSERERVLHHSQIDSSKVDFVYHGISESFHERSGEETVPVLDKYHLPRKYILYLGRLNRRKNIKALLEAFAIVESKVSLVIIGQKEYQEFELEDELVRLNISERVHIFKFVPYDDLKNILSAATLFVFPSFAEGFGLPPLEAMRSGVPTIVSTGMAMPEVCKDGAVYFEPSDFSQLAKKIDHLLTDKNVYDAYKLKGKQIAEEYTWDRSAKELLRILQNLVEKRN
jgi:glycosyltransferase involved in cell wall biosynthesis